MWHCAIHLFAAEHRLGVIHVAFLSLFFVFSKKETLEIIQVIAHQKHTIVRRSLLSCLLGSLSL